MAEGGEMQSVEGSPRRRRRRRTREEVEGRIIAVARELFADRGYAAATTREIARVADVSETLLFRYFGDKAQLFDAVVSTPFNALMSGFIASQVDAKSDEDGAHRMFVAVFDLFENNRDLMSAAFQGRGVAGDGGVPALRGLGPFFRESEQSQLRDNDGTDPGFDLAIGIRLAFGMIASAVLMRGWLFFDDAFERDEVVSTLETMIRKALGPLRRN